ncbi:MAG: hypothetical protein ACTHK0_00100, partial [Ginsengibacter sp.]
MAIVIFGDLFTFPDGNAATNRVYTYGKGFLEKGVNTYIICFGNEYIDEREGVINGLHFYHALNQKKRNKYFIIRRWQKLKKFYKCFLILKQINKKEPIDGIICYSKLIQTQAFGF